MSCAISRTCCLLTLPTVSLFGLAEPFSTPAAALLKKAAGVEKGSAKPNKEKVGKVSKQQVREIAQLKLKDLNAYDVEAAMKMVEGTARSLGIEVSA